LLNAIPLIIKMKTLKDLEIAGHDVIREEAIKWVKEDIEGVDNKDLCLIPFDIVHRWMKRLDITEEDLKWEK